MAIEIRDKVKDFLKNELNVELNLGPRYAPAEAQNAPHKITYITKGIEFLGYIFSRRNFSSNNYTAELLLLPLRLRGER